MKRYFKRIAFLLFIYTLFSIFSLGSIYAGPATTLISPANNYDCVNPNNAVFLWRKPAPNAGGFVLHISSRSNMSDTLYLTAGSDTTQTVTNLLPAMTYYWRVQTCYEDFTIPWSSIWSFKTKYPQILLSSPANNASCQLLSVPLSWSAYSGMTYRVQVSATADFASTVFDQSGISSNNCVATVPNNNSTYYWRVNCSTPAGCTNDWSQVRSFRTTHSPSVNNFPDNKSIRISLKAYLRWTPASSNPRSHRIQVATDSLFFNVVYDGFSNTASDTAVLINGNTEHFWRIKTSYQDCETDWSRFFSFTTLDAQTHTILPTKDSACLPYLQRFEWQNVPGINGYRLQVSESGSFSPLAFNRANLQRNWDTITLPKSLQQYYWRVRAEDAQNTGQWSDTGRFQTAIGYPVRLKPYNKQDSLFKNMVFRWKPIAQGVKYNIQISVTNDFATPLVDNVTEADTFVYKMPDFFKTYYWRMSAHNDNCQSNWSDIWQFRVVMPPPNPLTPSNGLSGQKLNISFTWDIPEGADKFGFQLSKNNTFTNIIVGRTGLTTNNTNVFKELEPATTYYWRVNASNASGTSFWSKAFTFMTSDKGPGAPILVFPGNGDRNLPVKVILTWQASEKATLYHVQVSDNGNFENLLADDEKVSGTTYELNLLKFGMTYHWHVSALNDSGKSSWSSTWSFTTVLLAPADAPNLVYPANNISDVPLKLTFLWDTVARAEGYDFQLTDKPDFNTNPLIYDSALYVNSNYVSLLNGNTIYTWRARARNGGGTGPWSEEWKFQSTTSSTGEDIERNNFNFHVLTNPVRDKIIFSYTLKVSGNINIDIFNQVGKKITGFAEGLKEPGNHCSVIVADDLNLPDGIYYITIKSGISFSSGKFIIMR